MQPPTLYRWVPVCSRSNLWAAMPRIVCFNLIDVWQCFCLLFAGWVVLPRHFYNCCCCCYDYYCYFYILLLLLLLWLLLLLSPPPLPQTHQILIISSSTSLIMSHLFKWDVLELELPHQAVRFLTTRTPLHRQDQTRFQETLSFVRVFFL